MNKLLKKLNSKIEEKVIDRVTKILKENNFVKEMQRITKKDRDILIGRVYMIELLRELDE